MVQPNTRNQISFFKRKPTYLSEQHPFPTRIFLFVTDIAKTYYLVLSCFFTFCFPCCDVRYDFRIKTMFRSYLPLVVCRRAHVFFLIHYLCLFAHSGVQHILCCVFVLFVFVLCLVYPMLPVSQDCPFLIAPSVFSNVYFF